MVDIETLQAENEKLNGRLRKAIQVFNQQKADIERLESEKTALSNRVSELEQIAVTSTENDTKFFEQLQEIDELKDLLNNANEAIKTHCNNYDKLKKETDDKIEDLTSKNKSLNGKLLSSNNKIKEQDDRITTLLETANTFKEKMRIFVNSIGEQSDALANEVADTKFE